MAQLNLRGFDELSDEEVLALTDEQTTYYIELECAKQGAPLLPPEPGPKPIAPEPKQDLTVYDVEGLLLDSLDNAQALANLLNTMKRVKKTYAPGGTYQHTIITPDEDPAAITSRREFSPSAWDACRNEITAHTAKAAAWERARDEYGKAADQRAKTTEWIREHISRLRDKQATRAQYESEFARYVELAKGDVVMAYGFLIKAKPEAAQFIADPSPAPVEAFAPEPPAVPAKHEETHEDIAF